MPRLRVLLHLLPLLLCACGSTQIPLDEQEAHWTARTGQAVGAKVWLQHERETFLTGRGRATLLISVEGADCPQDTVRLKQLGLRLATEAHAVVRYNCLYDSVEVSFSTEQKTDAHSSRLTCYRKVMVAMTPGVRARMGQTWLPQ